MIFGEHEFSINHRLAVSPANPISSGAILRFDIENKTALLDRRDVERLRDLCDEALA